MSSSKLSKEKVLYILRNYKRLRIKFLPLGQHFQFEWNDKTEW